MFAPLFLLLSAASALAVPTSSGELSVKLTAASSHVQLQDLLISATVSNPTAQDIRVLKYGTVLDELDTRSFAVSKDGVDVPFQGMQLYVDPESDGAYVTIPAGGSISIDHSIGYSYDFESTGEGLYTFEPTTRFQLDASGGMLEIKKDSVQIEITGDLYVAKAQLSTPVCSDAAKKQFITDTQNVGRSVAGGAASDIRNHPNSAALNSYFGGNNRDTLWYNFDRIAGDLASSGTRSLGCVASCNPGVVAYTSLVTSGGNIISSDVSFCPNFFTDYQPTSTVCTGTALDRDTIYGCAGARGLSSDAAKLGNADNYACFAEQIYKDYNC